MKRSRPAASVVSGRQTPRIEWVPDGEDHPDGDAALEVVAAAGITLDPWQERILRASLRRRGGAWAAFEVAVVCPRQNGKNALIEARQLAGLLVLGELLIVHSAHLATTAKVAFRRLEAVLDSQEWLSREVRHVWRTNGHEAIELRSGQRIEFRTRTLGAGRGYSGDCVFFDEAMDFPEASQQAIMPVVSAQPDPQLWYTGSAVDQLVHDHGRILAGVRERGIRGGDPSLAYFEWSLDYASPDDVPAVVAASREAWAESNPALEIRIGADYVAKEHRAFSSNPHGFAVERLGVGDWPSLGGDETVIDLRRWGRLKDQAEIVGRPAFAFDVSPDRAWAAVGVAGERPDGLFQVEVVEHRRGTGWVAGRLVEMVEKSDGRAVCDARGPAGSLIPDLERAGVTVEPVTAQEHAQACGLLFDKVEQEQVRHLGDPLLAAALANATRRPLGDAWAWSRRGSGADITPLVAITLALWAASQKPQRELEPMVALI